ncbi:MAG: thioredoxin domain-containing protein [bacterium]|nr:thioredoxin domain-containing protein [bacterium]
MDREKPTPFLSTPLAIVVAGVLIAGAIVLTDAFDIQLKREGSLRPSPQVAGTQTAPPPAGGPTTPQIVSVSVDDDPVLGNPNAPVTVIEFSDYECPYCKRSFQDMLPQLKKDYIDSGKVKLVYRDLPLPFHDPMATQEALAANCSRDQGGDAAYYRYHDEIFTRTTSNGNGLKKEDLTKIAQDLKLNSSTFQQCLTSEKFKSEIEKDLADAAAAGASGTPTFFVGKSSPNGIIQGTMIVGAQPYVAFKPVIDRLLAE